MDTIDTQDAPQSQQMVQAQDPGPQAPVQQGGPPPAAPVDTVSAPQSDQMLDAQQQAHHSRLAQMVDAIGSALGGGDEIHISRDANGARIVTKTPSTPAQKWTRIAQTALAGMAAGYAVPNGPGNIGRAAAAGVGTGMQQQQQAAQQREDQANQNFEATQKAQLHNANMAMLNQRLTMGAFQMRRDEIGATEADTADNNAFLKTLADHEHVDLGVSADGTDLVQLRKSNPDLLKSHTQGQIYQHKEVQDGKVVGIHSYWIDPTALERKNDQPVDVPMVVAGKDGGRPTWGKQTIPALGHTNGEIAAIKMAQEDKMNKLDLEWDKSEREKANTASEIAERRTAGVKNLAEAGKASAEGRKANVEAGVAQGAAADAEEAQAQQIAHGEVKKLNQSRNNPTAQRIMRRAYEINPQLSDSLYDATQDIRSSKPNSSGANVQRLGTAVLHGDRALANSHGLGFSEGLLTGVKTGGTAAYRQDAEFLTGEIGQYVTGGKLTVDEGKKISSDLFASRQSVRDSAIHEIIGLSGGKLQAQMQNFRNATGSEFPTNRVFNDPDIRGALDKHGVLRAATPPTAPAGAQATPQTHSFSLSAWQAKNPGGDPNAARAAAAKAGFQVVQ